LWESCPRCNVAQPRNERFCGQCGTDVRTLRDEQQNWANEQLVAAHQLTAECRFFDAARVIREVIAKLEGSSSPLIDTCRKLLPTINDTRTRMMAAATAAYEQARQLSATYDYKQAVKVLETIPELLREESMINLLDDVRSRASEVSQLKRSIRELVAARDYGAAIGRTERLLRIKPDHEEARQLVGQLAAKLEQAARQKQAAREFAAAVQALKLIPTEFRTTEQNALLNQLNESLYLLAQVLHAPVATEGLVRICERLVKLIGDDEKLRRLREELKRRVASDRESANVGHPSQWRH
jgi:tetratricopeptide (TPR) repeat protein